MESLKDKNIISKQLSILQKSNEKTAETLSAIRLLMVDNNNGRTKDLSLTRELDNLVNEIQRITDRIDSLVEQIN